MQSTLAIHQFLGVHVGTFPNQSLDNLRVPIHGSPDQGRPVLLRDEPTSRGCRLAISFLTYPALRDAVHVLSKEVLFISEKTRSLVYQTTTTHGGYCTS
jgi:hypothetical protein